VLFIANTMLMQVLGAPVLEALAALREPAQGVGRALLVVVLADVAGYWIHRLMHRVPWLWRFHAVHHAPTHLAWYQTWRQHPVDFVLHGVVVGVPGALLGVSLSELSSVVLLRKALTVFLHANVRWRFGALEQLIATPAFHHLHHGAGDDELDCNFAGTFPWVDRLFGTYRRPRFPERLGLASGRDEDARLPGGHGHRWAGDALTGEQLRERS
jgi:sterol desaturase/sphingolipid hydroxylase (fatty acid hydroxylase superfamily)